MPLDQRFPAQEFEAIARRFEIININDLLINEGYELKTKEELKELKKKKNADFSLCFRKIQRERVQDQIDFLKDVRAGVVEF